MHINKTLGEIAAIIDGEVQGNASLKVHRLLPMHQGEACDLSFLSRPQYVKEVKNTKVSALIVSREFNVLFPHVIWVENASQAVSKLTKNYQTKLSFKKSIHPTAVIGERSRVHPSATIEPYVVIGNNVIVGANTKIGAFSYLGDNVLVGEDVNIYPHVTIYADSVLKNHVVIHSGAVIGADGFGYENGSKIPHVGNVCIDNDVEIGANSCIDRARIGETRIGEHTKIDNLVQIGHGTAVGKNCFLCGQVGISGSVSIGNNVKIGGGTGVTDHASICDDVMLGGKTIVQYDIISPGIYSGNGPLPLWENKRAQTIFSKLPKMYRDLYRLLKQHETKND